MPCLLLLVALPMHPADLISSGFPMSTPCAATSTVCSNCGQAWFLTCQLPVCACQEQSDVRALRRRGRSAGDHNSHPSRCRCRLMSRASVQALLQGTPDDAPQQQSRGEMSRDACSSYNIHESQSVALLVQACAARRGILSALLVNSVSGIPARAQDRL